MPRQKEVFVGQTPRAAWRSEAAMRVAAYGAAGGTSPYATVKPSAVNAEGLDTVTPS